MECLKKLPFNQYTKEELLRISIEMPNEAVRKIVQQNWDHVAKPLDSMGLFERITAKIGAITGDEKVVIDKKAVIIMCADNGVVEEGISQSGQEVTLAVAKSMAKKQSSVGKMAAYIGADTIPVDIGINSDEIVDGVLDCKIRKGTRNFANEPAMTEKEVVKAIATGIEMVYACKQKGYHLLATGEMGIGNTTTTAACTAALLQCEASYVTGKGAGLSDEALLRKIQIVDEAIASYDLYHQDPFTILQNVGGLDIAGLVGVCIGGAIYRLPVVLDGVISLVAGYLAECLMPGTKEFLLASHMGKEPANAKLAEALGLDPVIYAGLALGEGTGAVMLFSLLDLAIQIYHEQTSFTDIEIEAYTRF